MQGYQTYSYRAATGELRLNKYLPYDTTLDFYVRSGLTFSQGSTSGLHSAGLRLNFTYLRRLADLSGRPLLLFPLSPGVHCLYRHSQSGLRSAQRGRTALLLGGGRARVSATFPRRSSRGSALLSGIVFEDRNHNGVFDAGDTPLKDVVVRLDNGYIVETDAEGRYHYPNVADGDHTLQLDPESYPVRLTPKIRKVSPSNFIHGKTGRSIGL